MLSMSANLVTKTEPHVTMFCAYGLFSNSLLWLWSEMLVAQSCPTLCNPMDQSPPCSLSMEISRQEYQNGLSFPSPGGLPNPETDPKSPVLQADRLPSEPPGRPILCLYKVSWGEVSLILSVSNTTSNLVALRGYNARFPPTCVPFLLVPFIPWLRTENTKLLISCLALPLCPNHFLLWFFYFYSQYHHSSQSSRPQSSVLFPFLSPPSNSCFAWKFISILSLSFSLPPLWLRPNFFSLSQL